MRKSKSTPPRSWYWAAAWVVFLLLRGVVYGYAQDTLSSYQLVTTIHQNNRAFTTDKLQQLYLVTPTNELIKYAADGREQFRFNNNTLGELAWVDATDPFNLLLFYPDYQVVITLDRTLNPTSETNLWAFDLVNLRAIGASIDNQLWVYDDGAFQLKKMDRSGRTLAASDNLSLLLPFPPRPTGILARENRVYLNDPEHGILVFDNFGQFSKMIDLRGLHQFQIREDRLFYRQDTTLVAYDLRSFLSSGMPLPAGVRPEDEVRLQRELLYLRKADRVEVYRVR